MPGTWSPGEHVPFLVHGDIVESDSSNQLDVARGACRLLERRCRDFGQRDELRLRYGLELAHDRDRAANLGPRRNRTNLRVGIEGWLS